MEKAIILLKAVPTQAQIEAGNYKKDHKRFAGLSISIENKKGTIRKDKETNGKKWQTKMLYDYGDIKGSKGMDGDEVDCFLGPNENASHVYIVHQRKAGDWKAYDEDKCMLGFDSEKAAKEAYLKHYDDKRFLGPVTTLPIAEFKKKVLATKDEPKMVKSFEKPKPLLLIKSNVPSHLEHLANGKVVPVRAYSNRVVKKQKASKGKRKPGQAHTPDLWSHEGEATQPANRKQNQSPATDQHERKDTLTMHQAIERELLVDVTRLAREAGFTVPVALSKRVLHDCVSWPKTAAKIKGKESDQDRLKSILKNAAFSIASMPDKAAHRIIKATHYRRRGEFKGHFDTHLFAHLTPYSDEKMGVVLSSSEGTHDNHHAATSPTWIRNNQGDLRETVSGVDTALPPLREPRRSKKK